MGDIGFFAGISQAFTHGGVWMWAILAVQIVSIAIIVERILALYVTRGPRQNKLANLFEADIKKGDLEKVLSRTNRMTNMNPIYNVARAGTQAALDMGGREEIQSKMDEVLLSENARLERGTGFLAMLGNVGTLLGLLGTIIGLIQAFGSVVGNIDPIQKAQVLTGGISMAMNTTAYGLIVAIPALIMFAVLQNRANRLAEDLNQGSLKVFNWLSFNYDSVPTRTVRRRSK